MEKTISIKNKTRIILHGFSQVILLKNSISGLLFLSAIIVSGLASKNEAILYAIASAILSPALAHIMKNPKDEIFSGLWGYNAILYGIALSMFIPFSVNSICLLIMGNIAIVSITPLLEKVLCGLPVLTMPFILTTWAAIVLSPPLETYPSLIQGSVITACEYFIASINNYIEIFLLSGVIGGVLVMVGIYIGNKTAFLVTLLISILSVALSKYDNTITLSQVVNGLYGYNIILTGVAVVIFKRVKTRECIIIGGASMFLSLFLSHVLNPMLSHVSLPLLTLPFVISTWVYLLLSKLVSVGR